MGASPEAEAGTRTSLACTPPRIQMKDVVTMARMVPVGMDFCASLRSPDRFEPAMIPTNMENAAKTHLRSQCHVMAAPAQRAGKVVSGETPRVSCSRGCSPSSTSPRCRTAAGGTQAQACLPLPWTRGQGLTPTLTPTPSTPRAPLEPALIPRPRVSPGTVLSNGSQAPQELRTFGMRPQNDSEPSQPGGQTL